MSGVKAANGQQGHAEGVTAEQRPRPPTAPPNKLKHKEHEREGQTGQFVKTTTFSTQETTTRRGQGPDRHSPNGTPTRPTSTCRDALQGDASSPTRRGLTRNTGHTCGRDRVGDWEPRASSVGTGRPLRRPHDGSSRSGTERPCDPAVRLRSEHPGTRGSHTQHGPARRDPCGAAARAHGECPPLLPNARPSTIAKGRAEHSTTRGHVTLPGVAVIFQKTDHTKCW